MPNKGFLTSGVVGNGMTLGLTNGTNTGGLVNTINIGLMQYSDAYGEDVGSPSYSTGLDYQSTVGVTTDADKSGLVVKADSYIKYCIKY